MLIYSIITLFKLLYYVYFTNNFGHYGNIYITILFNNFI